jgi:cbb3-type cytochrome oxidase subunit 3
MLGRRQLGRRGVVGCASIGLAGFAAMLAWWPETPAPLAGLLAVVLTVGMAMWWSARGEPGATSELGVALMAGVFIAVAVFAFQTAVEDRRRADADVQEARRRADAERQQLLLMLGLQPNLTGIDLHGRDLQEVYLARKILDDARLDEANLSKANLRESRLKNASLIETNLTHADLSHSDLRGAKMVDANLHQADLHEADLRDAILHGATLTQTILKEADLRGADLSYTVVDKVDLRGAVADSRTSWPMGFDWHRAGVKMRHREKVPVGDHHG